MGDSDADGVVSVEAQGDTAEHCAQEQGSTPPPEPEFVARMEKTLQHLCGRVGDLETIVLELRDIVKTHQLLPIAIPNNPSKVPAGTPLRYVCMHL